MVDGVLMPVIAIIGFVLTMLVAPRARRYVQGGLIAAAMVTLIAIPLIHRQGQAQPGQALLTQDYAAHLFTLLGLIAAATVIAYAIRFTRDARQQASVANTRPPEDHDSAST